MNPLYTIQTSMKREEYRKFLYIATFFSSYLKIPLIVLISVLGTFIIGNKMRYNIFMMIFLWLILFSITIFALCFEVEKKNQKGIQSDDIGQFDSLNIIKFYEDKAEFDNRILRAKFKIEYNKIYRILESKDFFIIFITKTQATMIRKDDVLSLYDFTIFLKEKLKNRFKKLYVNI